jgi:hypothetical protein
VRCLERQLPASGFCRGSFQLLHTYLPRAWSRDPGSSRPNLPGILPSAGIARLDGPPFLLSLRSLAPGRGAPYDNSDGGARLRMLLAILSLMSCQPRASQTPSTTLLFALTPPATAAARSQAAGYPPPGTAQAGYLGEWPPIVLLDQVAGELARWLVLFGWRAGKTIQQQTK